MALLDDIRRYWDDDAATYDDAAQHRPTDRAVQAAWTAAVHDALPPAPARVLDCGAGTGFLSLIAARLGHRVTALDLSPAMAGRLRQRAADEGLTVRVVVGPATAPPASPDGPGGQVGYDAVIERHLMWTLPDPAAALAAWREVAGAGARLVLVESLWGGRDLVERRRGQLRRGLRRLRPQASEHHAEYGPGLRASLPLGSGTDPARLVRLATDAGWANPRLRRLADVEWAERLTLPIPERAVGVTPRFVVSAVSAAPAGPAGPAAPAGSAHA